MTRIGRGHRNGRSSRGNNRGFTMIELLVAIGIIVVLIGLTVPIISKVKKSAYATSTQNTLNVIQGAIEIYYQDFHAYPGPLTNNQIGSGGTTVATNAPYIIDSNNNNVPLTGVTNIGNVTGTENLVLGLLGGLNVVQGNPGTFSFSPSLVGVGARNLGTTPKTNRTYLQVTTGMLSTGGTLFKDDAGQSGTDTEIPEFLDGFPNPMPILYLRARVGAQGLVSLKGKDHTGTALAQPVQYDLQQVTGYVTSDSMSQNGVGISTSSAPSYTKDSSGHATHGLQKLGASATDTMASVTASNSTWTSGNGIAYFKDPNIAQNYAGTVTESNGTPIAKDGYILIGAGPDRVFGTADDISIPAVPDRK